MASLGVSKPLQGDEKNQKICQSKTKIFQSVESMKQQMRVSEEEENYRALHFEQYELKEHIKSFKCTKCGVSFQNKNQRKKLSFHPLLDVLMCVSCCNYYGNGEFSLDSEGEDKYCRWCGEGGTLFSCSKCICAFCNKCIKKHFGESGLKKVENDDDWVCYFCNPKPLWHLRSICSLAKEVYDKKNFNSSNTKIISARKKNFNEKTNDANSNSSDSAKSVSSSSDSTRRVKRRKLKRPFRKSGVIEQSSSSENENESENENQSKKLRPGGQRKDDSTYSTEAELDKSKKRFRLDEDCTNVSLPDKGLNEKPEAEQHKIFLVEKLKGIWKMIQLLTEVGLKWSKEKLEFLSKPNNLKDPEEFQKEFKKLKSVSIMLSSSINKVYDSVETLKCDMISENVKDGSYILQKEKDNFKNLINKLQEEIDQNSSLFENKSEKQRTEKVVSEDMLQKTVQQSQSLFSGSETDTETENKSVIVEVQKRFLTVKDFAKMNSENFFEVAKSTAIGNKKEDEEKEEKRINENDARGEKSFLDEYNAETEGSEDEVVGKEKTGKEYCQDRNLNNERKDNEKNTRKNLRKSDLENKFGNFRERRKLYLKNISLNENSAKKILEDKKITLKESECFTSAEKYDDQDDSTDHDNNIKVFSRKPEKKKQIFSSDEKSESNSETSGSGESDVSSDKPKKTESDSSSSSDKSSGIRKHRWKRIRKEKQIKKSEENVNAEETEQKTEKVMKGRRNIKKILKKDYLKVTTKEALNNEKERRKRVEERNEKLRRILEEKEGDINLKEQYNKKKVKHLILDFDDETKEPLVTVHKKLVKKLKPHQKDGIKFMWDNCFESVKRSEEEVGSGCILAHYMGLGKTLQVIAFIHTIMNHELGVKTVLIICPLNVVNNWLNEFNAWLTGIRTETILLYEMGKYKKTDERCQHLQNWHLTGGVLVISYDLFRNFTNLKSKNTRKTYKQTLLDPGPDLVVCDEGHLLKNQDTALSKCVNQIKTARRVILTGTPLQNNLVEYHCMVHFVKPNLLGTKKEFSNRFINPIINGQFEDSTEEDVKMMKKRSHVLHGLLSGCVQRCDYSVLTPYLPEKQEYVLSISLTEAQKKAYRYFIENLSTRMTKGSKTASLFNDYHTLQRVWTHPRILLMHKENEEEKVAEVVLKNPLKNFIVESNEESSCESESGSEASVKEIVDEFKKPHQNLKSCDGVEEDTKKEDYKSLYEADWWIEFFKKSDFEDIRAGNKLLVLLFLLKSFENIGDKVLVFSQSLYSLDLIEYFLNKIDDYSSNDEEENLATFNTSWVRGLDYFRLDGSTSSELRTRWCKSFNKRSNRRARLFLISTKAGGLGINLCSANRVIIFDASWNPSHDLQSIFRVYRFGQKKICYVYRLLAEGTMEEKIYERQVTKLSLSHRVVDELQIERHYSMMNIKELYNFSPVPKEERKTPKLPKDKILAELLVTYKNEVVSYHEHDSLLENQEEQELTEEERKIAWQEFEQEKEQKTLSLNDMLSLHNQMKENVASASNNLEVLNAMTHIPVQVLERGFKVGLMPVAGENIDSYLNRIYNRELFFGYIQKHGGT